MSSQIRKVRQGDEKTLAYIQTESWKAAFKGIVPAELLEKSTEIICIHSLQDKWHQGYGSQMMKQILSDIKASGFDKVMLWVFEENIRAIDFYKKHGFISNGRSQKALGAVEVMYERNL